MVGARVVELFEYGECLLPGLAGCVDLADGFLGMPELDEDLGFGVPVSDLAEDRACLLVVVDGIADASIVMAGFSELLESEGVLPSVASLLKGGYCLLAQGDGGLEGFEAFMDSAEPGQGHALSPDIGGLAGSCQGLLDAVSSFAELPEVHAGESLQDPRRPLAARRAIAGPGLGAVRLPADRGGTWPSTWASPGMRLYALAGVRSVVATTGIIPERRMAGLGPRARVCGWPANEVRAGRLIRWVPLVFAGEQAAVA
jgi:hypothetical protein